MELLLLMRSWITSATLFLLLNIIICIIALTSKSLSQRRPNDPAASSALHRLRSLSLARLRSGDFFSHADEMSADSPKKEVAEKEDENSFCRSQSEKGESSASERSVRGSFEKKEVVGEEVDARADDFINKFRQQLRLQRLDSLRKYMEMLHRGK